MNNNVLYFNFEKSLSFQELKSFFLLVFLLAQYFNQYHSTPFVTGVAEKGIVYVAYIARNEPNQSQTISFWFVIFFFSITRDSCLSLQIIHMKKLVEWIG